MTEERTDFRIVTVIQYASDPPTENEIAIDTRLNTWPVSPPWKAGDDLPHNIKPPGLSIVLDKSRAGSDQYHCYPSYLNVRCVAEQAEWDLARNQCLLQLRLGPKLAIG